MARTSTPQVPGEIPGTDPDALAQLLEQNVGEIVAGLDELSDADLVQLAALEASLKDRNGVADGIAAEQRRRAGDPPADTIPEAGPAPVGDEQTYAHMRARDVDPRKIDKAYLTLDGWVCPHPAAKPAEA